MDSLFSKADVSKTSSISSTTIYGISIVVLFVLGALLYWWFRPTDITKTVMGPYVLNSSVTANSTETIFGQTDVESVLGNNFTLGFFVYMADVNRERISVGGPSGDFRFKPLVYILGVGDVLIDPIHQVGQLRIKPVNPEGKATINIDKIMAARWNQIVITMEGRSIDVYLNGNIMNSVLLDNLPNLKPLGVLLEKSPDFAGQAGLFQSWPRRLSEQEIMRNYKRNTDTRGKPLIPDEAPSILDIFRDMGKALCELGFCGFRFRTGPMEYVDYEFA